MFQKLLKEFFDVSNEPLTDEASDDGFLKDWKIDELLELVP